MKVGTRTQSTIQPDKFSFNHLFNGDVELMLCENIEAVEKERKEDGKVVTETRYEYDMYLETHKVTTYEQLASALVGLKYAFGDEIALMKKGMINPKNEEFVAYNEFVSECKAFAKEVTAEV